MRQILLEANFDKTESNQNKYCGTPLILLSQHQKPARMP